MSMTGVGEAPPVRSRRAARLAPSVGHAPDPPRVWLAARAKTSVPGRIPTRLRVEVGQRAEHGVRRPRPGGTRSCGSGPVRVPERRRQAEVVSSGRSRASTATVPGLEQADRAGQPDHPGADHDHAHVDLAPGPRSCYSATLLRGRLVAHPDERKMPRARPVAPLVVPSGCGAHRHPGRPTRRRGSSSGRERIPVAPLRQPSGSPGALPPQRGDRRALRDGLARSTLRHLEGRGSARRPGPGVYRARRRPIARDDGLPPRR